MRVLQNKPFQDVNGRIYARQTDTQVRAQETLAAMEQREMRQRRRERRLEQAFAAIDDDRGGHITLDELRKEMRDEPEEVYMGAGKKTKTSKYEDMLEEQEMESFRRVQMSKKEKKALRNKRLEGMEDRLENLDDDFKAI